MLFSSVSENPEFHRVPVYYAWECAIQPFSCKQIKRTHNKSNIRVKYSNTYVNTVVDRANDHLLTKCFFLI